MAEAKFGLVFVCVFLAVTGVKLLMMLTYHSTDFEVHRNWLAITYNLPMAKWYYENTSIWTLDYPPAFAWFEFGMAQIAARIDPEIVRLDNLDYAAPSVVFFQRLSVIVSELVLIVAVFVYAKSCSPTKAWSVTLLTLLSPGILIVDHMHFQYNGFLFGVLVWSILAFQQGRYYTSAVLFALLLNLKHIFLYCAPAFTLALLKFNCFDVKSDGAVDYRSFSVTNLFLLAVTTSSVFALSFGPFLAHLPQVLSRLFPFQRGLMHAYWAPNAWALYAIADKFLDQLGQRYFGFSAASAGSMTGGLVKEQNFAVLPQITPRVTFVTTLLFIIPGLVAFWMKSTQRTDLARLIVFSSLVSFLFGWHVHEKAICMVLLPFGLFFAVDSANDYRSFAILSLAGYFSLFPLIFTEAEYPIKLSIYCIYLFVLIAVAKVNNFQQPFKRWWIFAGFLIAAGAIELAPLSKRVSDRLPFLPLLLTSVLCAVVVIFATFLFALNAGRSTAQKKKVKSQ